eukprot:CAMPEP_0116890464 /NCGR_PEP_ID=MMETSP0467-20121206/1000_1 /TAXON_ID=283647 /ORGANISM="Mesodinium pulex, Strain SPMC105" /LENGTH=121 /DNA_ID=CAMNT_0004558245 /DNA_START=320 /DNA_END=685 /DNA_ORIENTATION=+
MKSLMFINSLTSPLESSHNLLSFINKTAKSSIGHTHILLHQFVLCKSDVLVKDRMVSCLNIYQVLSDYIKFSNLTIDFLIERANYIPDQELEEVEFNYLLKNFIDSNELNRDDLTVFKAML